MTLSHPPRRIEANADLMINTLFDELDQTLEKDGNLDREEGTENLDFSAEGIYVSRSELAAYSNPDHSHQNSHPPFTDDPEYVIELDSFLEEDFPQATDQNSTSFWARHLDKFFFFSACSLLMGSLLLLEKDDQFSLASLQKLQTAMAGADLQATAPIDTNPEFIRYMERALAEIDHQQELAKKVEAQRLSEEPIQPVQAMTPQPNSTSLAQKTSPQPISALPALPPPPPPLQNAQPPAPQPTASASSTPQPKPPATQQPATKAVTAPQTPTSKPATPSSSPTQPPAPEMKPQTSAHQLVGLLELGEHSAALLKVEGATQRIMLEETIPGSNWTLVSVANQKATFMNNEQQKVMFVGEEMSVQ
ncbi:MAG: hypothetical protein GVY17_12195 [Cyanobacteria bacterium]|jgi:hypothetical protein|nr:hypothetical protein [Cyanobacteria bacterium GSL.Bin21]